MERDDILRDPNGVASWWWLTIRGQVTVAGALAFAILWNRFVGQGPLERLVATASNRARRRAMARLTAPHDDPDAAQNSSG
jgi:hypothetical protein